MKVNTIIFDLGGVLIDWNPRYLYKKIFKTEQEVEKFLSEVCTNEWNEKQDAGRTFAEAREELVSKYPNHESAIQAWHARWPEMIRGPIDESVSILQTIRQGGKFKIFALTNWSAETFPFAIQRFEFLKMFDGIVVSGHEKTRKPFPDFYRILLNRYSVDPNTALFIDDNHMNVEAGTALGMHCHHFRNASLLRDELKKLGILN